MSVFSQPSFHNEPEAFKYLESIVWANGVVCPHCGVVAGRVYDLADVRGSKSKKNPEGAIRHGLKKCGECRQQFTAKVGTVFEHARMPLHKMLQAVHLMISSKKGISSHQLSRILECTYKAAWFLSHRIREAMRSGDLTPFGSGGTAVEADETYFGVKKGARIPRGGHSHKMGVLALVDRASGTMRTFTFDKFRAEQVQPIVLSNISREARLMTDESRMYWRIGREFAEHGRTLHGVGRYVDRDDRTIHTNTVENVRQHLAERGFEQTLDGIKRTTPPTLKVLDGEQEAKIIATRLGPPPAGYANWTLRLLACKVVELSIVESVSHETIRRTLKKVA